RLATYEEIDHTEVSGSRGILRQADREQSVQGLININRHKRLEGSVETFRITAQQRHDNHTSTLAKSEQFKKDGIDPGFVDVSTVFENTEPDDDEEYPEPDPEGSIGGKVKVRLSDMDLPSWEHDLREDQTVITGLLAEMRKITP